MTTMIKYVAPILTAVAIGGPIGLAPVALAAPGSAPVAPSTATNVAPTSAPFGTVVDPLVPAGGGADPYVPNYPGRAFEHPVVSGTTNLEKTTLTP